MEYKPSEIEPKWQKYWEENEPNRAEDFSKKPKLYVLVEFPYPSGDGLHVGHCRSYTALDVISRKKRMEGFNVLFPMGWDAFGLPTENYAIKTKVHPSIVTEKNTAYFKQQEKSMGFSFDWSREINTTEPEYYKWTQWIFLKLYESGLAYKSKMPINWCPSCKIGLANEEVIDGSCERCSAKVEKKEKEQWLLRITKYADRLIKDLNLVDYPEKVKTLQKDWIGRSEGLEESWQVEGVNLKLKTFTTWPHTSWGSTFMVIAPEHPIIDELVRGTEYEKSAKDFCKKIIQDKIKDPKNVEKKKEGFFIGRYVINHLNGRKMPLFIANFAIYDYGTGIVKCTPAHDQRDFEFAQKYNLETIPVIYPAGSKPFDPKKMKEAYTGEGIMMNAGNFDGMPTEKARKEIGDYTIKEGNGRWTINYKLRDWVFSRQHYWGEPIPMVNCGKCGWVPVPEEDLPVELPKVEKYQPTDTGESPLAAIKEWVDTKCPKCGGAAERETDTMPNWAGSNWYFLRYCDPKNNKKLADEKLLEYWLPVDWYNGGMEHTTLHLLYSRFIYKFLWDIGAVPKVCGPEPYKKRTSHGMVLGEGGIKMSKSKGNVINPDQVVAEYGADTLRVYEMFIGPFGDAISWDTKGVKGVKRFLERFWRLSKQFIELKNNKEPSDRIKKLLHKTIKKVSEDIDVMKFNTAVSSMMEFSNAWQEEPLGIEKEDFESFLKIIAPFTPHLAEELWRELGHKKSISSEEWPKYDKELIKEDKINLIIQINGRVRDAIEVELGVLEEKAKEIALSRGKIQNWTKGQKVKKVIFIPGKLINIVI